MVFTRQKERAGTNPVSTTRNQPGNNKREVPNSIQKVFTREHNDLLIQPVLQYSQEDKGDELHYIVLGLTESSTEDDMKNSIVP